MIVVVVGAYVVVGPYVVVVYGTVTDVDVCAYVVVV